jgi:predicted N-acetyltransferase YhbS
LENKNVTYTPILIKELVAFADKVISSATESEFVPISEQRAKAMANNPIASPDDIAMMVAFLGDEVIGYFGIMPILLWHDGVKSKVHWFSTWNVSPKARGLGVGSQLMAECLKFKYDFMIVGSKPARKVSEKFGFHEMSSLSITSIDFISFWRLNPLTILARASRKIASILRKDLDISGFTKDLEGWLHAKLGNQLKSIMYPMLLKRLNINVDQYSWSSVKHINNWTPPKTNEIKFLRDDSVINWMLNDPWVVKPGESRTEYMDFYFSDIRDEFENVAIQVSKQNESIGFITYQISEIQSIKMLKIEDVQLPEQNLAIGIILDICKELQIDKIVFNTKHINYNNFGLIKKLLFLNNQRIYQCFPANENSPLGKNWKKIQLDYPDGDMGFS